MGVYVRENSLLKRDGDILKDRLLEFSKLNKQGKLKLIKCMISSLVNLARGVEKTNPDFAKLIKEIILGNEVSVSGHFWRYCAVVFSGKVYTFDTVSGKIVVTDKNGDIQKKLIPLYVKGANGGVYIIDDGRYVIDKVI